MRWLEWLDDALVKHSSSNKSVRTVSTCVARSAFPTICSTTNGGSGEKCSLGLLFAWLGSWQVCLGVQLGIRACFQAFHVAGRSATYDCQVYSGR